MKNLKRNLKLTGLALLLAGCEKATLEQKSPQVDSYKAPEGNAGEGESIGNLDWATVRKDNPGYEIDMNGDGRPDYVRLESDGKNSVLYFGINGNRKNLVPILIMNGQIVAYNIGSHKEIVRPSLIYFTPDGKGYIRENLGQNSEGIPYFGGEQSVE